MLFDIYDWAILMSLQKLLKKVRLSDPMSPRGRCSRYAWYLGRVAHAESA
jgi:hypothetical protein